MILCASPLAQYHAQKAEIDAAIQKVLESGHYVLGPEVKAFEAEFAAYSGVSHCIGVANGTDAIHVGLGALGVGPGDEVITVAHTAVATVSAIVQAGATPVFADIDPETYGLDPALLSKLATPKTKAIIAVHIYGHPVDLDPVLAFAKSRGIKVIEDCAQSHGAFYKNQRVGSIADISCFSFYPTKNLGALGDGGAVCTKDSALAERARLIRQYGWAERYISKIHGWNTRLDELQAAVLRIKLRRLDRDNEERQSLAQRYSRGLSGLPLQLPKTREWAKHVFHLFAISTEKRQELQAHLQKKEIQALVHYPMPVHLQEGYSKYARGALPVTERLAREELSLPLYPGLPAESVERVVAAIRDFAGGARA